MEHASTLGTKWDAVDTFITLGQNFQRLACSELDHRMQATSDEDLSAKGHLVPCRLSMLSHLQSFSPQRDITNGCCSEKLKRILGPFELEDKKKGTNSGEGDSNSIEIDAQLSFRNRKKAQESRDCVDLCW